MLCCIAEIAMFVFGILALARGRFTLTSSRVVQGGPARAIGILLLLPLTLGQGGGFVLGALKGFEKGTKRQQFGPEDIRALETPLLILNAGTTGVVLLVVVVIALINAQPAPPKRRREDVIDEELGKSERESEDRGQDERPPRRPPDDRF